MKDKRKTISGEDVIQSLGILGYEDFLKVLNLYMEKYRTIMKTEET